MNCEEACNFLSRFYDGELGDEFRDGVALHVWNCELCKSRLGEFEALSALAGDHRVAEPANDLWKRIEHQLDSELLPTRAPVVSSIAHSRSRRPYRIMVPAAALLFASLYLGGLGFWMSSDNAGSYKNAAANPGRNQAPDEHGQGDEHPLRLDQYLAEFQKSTTRAQQVLFANHLSRRVTLNEATSKVNYRPAIANGLPPGYTVQHVYLVRLCCCFCVQAVIATPHGRELVVMEHASNQPVQYGEFPVVFCECNGKEIRIGQFGNQLIGTWTTGSRRVSVVGAENLEQLVELMRQLDQPVA